MDILLPPSGRGPGVLVAHPWWGLNRTIRDYGAALAEQGFVVALPDLFDGDLTTSIETAETLIRKHWDNADARLNAALDQLGGHDAVVSSGLGAVGFSFGGFHLLEAIERGDTRIARAVIYYATHPLPEQHVPLMAHLAAEDAYESAEDMVALSSAIGATAHSYPGTAHWFAEADRPEYNPAAARLAFERTVEFLRS
ncbi:MAG TPA: dienelactone hydrolase family protein [Devosia sp.]|jgi:carboxymethylenebutenolidase|nr:dienelactone hydrolase family protein [Devosia sp.]